MTYDNSTTTHKVLVRNNTTGVIDEATITESGLVGSKTVSETNIADERFLMYNQTTDEIEYRTITQDPNAVTRFRRDEFTGDNSTTQFNLANPLEGVVYVEMNGLIQDLGDDYTIDTVNDRINFVTAPPTNYDIVVFYYETTGIILPPPVGETNDGANLGAGENVFAQKSGSTLQFKTLTEGSNITLTSSATEIQVNANIPTPPTYTAGSGIGITGTQFYVTAGTGLGQESTGLSLNHLGIQNMSDPGADRVAFWDDSAGTMTWLTMGSNLSISGTTLNSSFTNTQRTDEEIRDLCGAMSQSGTQTDITVTHNDSANTINYAVDNVFVRKDTTTQDYSFSSNKLTWDYTSGASASYVKLNGNAYEFYQNASSSATVPNAQVKVDTLHAQGEVTAFSDIRLKENIEEYFGGLDDIKKLRTVTYDLKHRKDDKKQLGLIAQEVEEVIPEIVFGGEDDTYKSLDYSKLTMTLINAVKELSAEVNVLKEEIKQLKGE